MGFLWMFIGCIVAAQYGYICRLNREIQKFDATMAENTQLLFVDASAVDVAKLKSQVSHLLIEVIPVQLSPGDSIQSRVSLVE